MPMTESSVFRVWSSCIFMAIFRVWSSFIFMAIFSLGALGQFSRISVGLFLMGYVYLASSFGLLLLGWGSLNLVAADSPCNYSSQTCGTLSIPYPFGMSSECGLPEYRILCKPNSSYGEGNLTFLQVRTDSTPELQVQKFSTNTITVNTTQLKAMSSYKLDCIDVGRAFLDLSSSGPFVLSNDSSFAVIGCRSTGSCVASSSYSIECSTGCYNQFDFAFCNTYACCVIAIPPGSRQLNLTGNGIQYAAFNNVCGFSTVLSPSTYVAQKRDFGVFGAGQYGLVISWALILNTSENCTTVKNRTDYACSGNAECLDDSWVPGYTCTCSEGYTGDGYKHGIGCQDINECDESLDNCEQPSAGGNCTNTVPGYTCSCLEGYRGNGFKNETGCSVADKKTDVALPTTLGGLAGAFMVTVLVIIVYGSRRTYRLKKQRAENFHRNRGEELRSMLFSEEQLRRATNNFSREHELGKGGYGTVYWGNLLNHGKVAIKKAKHMDDAEREEDQMKSFVSEILLLGKTTHDNIVQLLGCCVETRVPLLVYEFVENGTLWDHLHPDRNDQKSLSLLGSSWARRLSIAVDTAKAVNYLHKMSPPILHRDIKSANILINKSYNPKVADFGASRFLTSGATHLTFAVVVGTHGYLDPEYHLSCQFTNKSDVYSFGVILLELITSMPADLGTQLGILAHHFRTSFRIGNLTSLIDPRLSITPNVLASIQDVAELAIHCLAMEGDQRPSMEEVLSKLKGIQSKRMLLDEVVVESYAQGSSALSEHYMRTIVAQQSPCNSKEHETASLLSPSHWSTATSSTAELALTCFSSEYSQEN